MRNRDAVKKVRFYKVLSRAGRACYGGNYQYDLPKNGKPGAWSTPISQRELEMCSWGYHVAHATSLLEWYETGRDQRVYLVEVRSIKSPRLFESDKVVCSSIRLVRRVPVTCDFTTLYRELNSFDIEDSLERVVRDCRRLDKLLAGSAKHA